MAQRFCALERINPVWAACCLADWRFRLTKRRSRGPRREQPALGIVCLLPVCLAACGSPDGAPSAAATPDAIAFVQASVASQPRSGDSTETLSDSAATRDTSRKIIYEADVRLVVEDFSGLPDAVRTVVRRHEGYVAQARIDGVSGRCRTGTWTLRVSAAHYQNLLDELETLGELQSRSEKSREVTAEFIDLQARVLVRRQEESRLLEHLQQQAGKLEEILRVEKELLRVREDLERLQGQLRVLSDRVEYSTITLTIEEIETFVPPAAATLATRVARSWTASWGTLSDLGQILLVAAAGLSPWLLTLGLPAGVLLILLKRAGLRRPLSESAG